MMSSYPRGFVKNAQQIAVEERSELGLGSFDPLDPWELAELHGVRILKLSQLASNGPSAEAVDAFTGHRQSVFSAALLPLGNGAMIVENDSHSRARRVANVTHEMSHVLLEHDFHASLANGDCRGTTSPTERQADRLAIELLVPGAAGLACARRGLSDDEVADMFGISAEMARMCLNLTGARKRATYERRARSARR